jgi:hypothetical protein
MYFIILSLYNKNTDEPEIEIFSMHKTMTASEDFN